MGDEVAQRDRHDEAQQIPSALTAKVEPAADQTIAQFRDQSAGTARPGRIRGRRRLRRRPCARR